MVGVGLEHAVWPQTLTWGRDLPGLGAASSFFSICPRLGVGLEPPFCVPMVLRLCWPCPWGLGAHRGATLLFFWLLPPSRGLQSWLMTPGAAIIQIIVVGARLLFLTTERKKTCRLSTKPTLSWTANPGEIQAVAVPGRAAFMETTGGNGSPGKFSSVSHSISTSFSFSLSFFFLKKKKINLFFNEQMNKGQIDNFCLLFFSHSQQLV